MCNTKNTETIRQQLWCNVVTSNIGELTFDKILAEADKVVAEFDKRFNNKLNCQGSSIEEMKIEKVEPIIFDLKRPKVERREPEFRI